MGWELRIQVAVSILHDEEKNTHAIMGFGLLQMWIGQLERRRRIAQIKERGVEFGKLLWGEKLGKLGDEGRG